MRGLCEVSNDVIEQHQRELDALSPNASAAALTESDPTTLPLEHGRRWLEARGYPSHARAVPRALDCG